ncbi:MAG: phenylalanine--tRNA ligase subunit alpha, partial [Bacteroidales bacterium]
MTENLENYHEEIRNFITDKLDELDQFRLKFLGKKGILVQLFEQIKEIPPAERKDFGKDINILKSMVLEKVNVLKNQIESTSNSTYESMDLSRPANCISLGSRHPLSIVSKQISDVFKKIGYTIAEGPEIEDDWHN